MYIRQLLHLIISLCVVTMGSSATSLKGCIKSPNGSLLCFKSLLLSGQAVIVALMTSGIHDLLSVGGFLPAILSVNDMSGSGIHQPSG
jgi:hypothetical protein